MPARARSRLVNVALAASGLLGGSLALLYVGHFIEFDDLSGSGSQEWVMPVGLLAGLAAIGSCIVATTQPTVRRLLGGAIAALDAWLIWQAATNDGFRFIWGGDEGDLVLFQIGLGMTALVLMTPRFLVIAESTGSTRSAPVLSGQARALSYLGLSLLVVFSAFVLGMAHFESTQCSGPEFDGECDLAGLEGMVWGMAALVCTAVVIAILEVIRLRRGRVDSTA
jgi:hypothetical protein